MFSHPSEGRSFGWSIHCSSFWLVGPSFGPFTWFLIQTVSWLVSPLIIHPVPCQVVRSFGQSGLCLVSSSLSLSVCPLTSHSFCQYVRVLDVGSFVGQSIGLSLGWLVLLLGPLLGSSFSRSLSGWVGLLVSRFVGLSVCWSVVSLSIGPFVVLSVSLSVPLLVGQSVSWFVPQFVGPSIGLLIPWLVRRIVPRLVHPLVSPSVCH